MFNALFFLWICWLACLIYWLHHAYCCVGRRGHTWMNIERPRGGPHREILVICNSVVQNFNWNGKKKRREWEILDDYGVGVTIFGFCSSSVWTICQDIPHPEFHSLPLWKRNCWECSLRSHIPWQSMVLTECQCRQLPLSYQRSTQLFKVLYAQCQNFLMNIHPSIHFFKHILRKYT